MGNLQQALVCFEKRLVIAHELGGEGGGKAQAYWELGTLHSQLGNYEQALSCLEHQLSIARAAGVRRSASDTEPLQLSLTASRSAAHQLSVLSTARTNPWSRRRATRSGAFTS